MKFTQSPYYSPRGDRRIVGVVLHTSVGFYEGTIKWFQNNPNQVSAHYVVSLDGDVTQMVDEADAAHHAGIVSKPTFKHVLDNPGVNPNLYTIGIECVDDNNPAGADRSKQYPVLARLVKEICEHHGIAINRENICGHREIRSTKTCPGNLDVDYVVKLAQELSVQKDDDWNNIKRFLTEKGVSGGFEGAIRAWSASHEQLLKKTEEYEQQKKGLEDKIRSLENLLEEDHNWADVADRYERGLKVVIKFLTENGLVLPADPSPEAVLGALQSLVASLKTLNQPQNIEIINYTNGKEEKMLERVLNFLKGKKTYFVAVSAIAYGLLKPDMEVLLLGLGLIGLRDGVATEVAKLLVNRKK